MFNGYVGANLAFAYDRIGLFGFLKPETKYSKKDIAQKTGCIEERLQALLKAGIDLGFMEKDEQDLYSWTASGIELAKHVGYFTWSVGGYGDFFRKLGTLATDDNSWSHLRDGSMVALGSDQANRAFMSDILFDALDTLSFSNIADFGCGNAGRLIQFCKRYPHALGVGVDINQDAIELARHNVQAQGMDNRIELYCENVLDFMKNTNIRDKLKNIEVVTCFMMLHDLFNISNLAATLFDRLRSAFPAVKYFIIADTVRMPESKADDLPIFNIGFELLHGYMGVKIHEKSDYDEAFIKAGLTIEKCLPFGTPNTYLYVLRV